MIIKQRINKDKEGINLCQGFLILKCEYCAPSIKIAITVAGIKAISGYHIAAIKSKDRKILLRPINFLKLSV